MIISNFSTTVDQALTNADLEGSQSPKSPSILKSHLKIVGSPEKSVRFQSQSQSKNTIVKINPSFKEKLQANLGFSGNPYAIIKPSVNKLQQESPIQSSNRVKTIISTTKDKLMQRIDLNLNTKSKTHIKARSFSLIPFNNNFDESDIDKTPSPSRQTKKALDFRPRSINYEFRSSRFYGRLSQFYKSESSTVSIENTPVVNGQNMTWQHVHEDLITSNSVQSENTGIIEFSNPKDTKNRKSNVFIHVKANSISPIKEPRNKSVRELLITIRNRDGSNSPSRLERKSSLV